MINMLNYSTLHTAWKYYFDVVGLSRRVDEWKQPELSFISSAQRWIKPSKTELEAHKPKLTQGRTKAEPRPNQGQTKAEPMQNQGSTKVHPRFNQGSIKAQSRPNQGPTKLKPSRFVLETHKLKTGLESPR